MAYDCIVTPTPTGRSVVIDRHEGGGRTRDDPQGVRAHVENRFSSEKRKWKCKLSAQCRKKGALPVTGVCPSARQLVSHPRKAPLPLGQERSWERKLCESKESVAKQANRKLTIARRGMSRQVPSGRSSFGWPQ